MTAREIDFATKLYGELARATNGNVVLSPTSVRLALGLAYAGARGETAQQMRAVLGELEHAAVRAQLERWDALANPPRPDGYDPAQPYWLREMARRSTSLAVANRLWIQQDKPILADYLALVQRDYRADATSLDFARDVEAARAVINAWVSENTDHHIEQLIPPRALTADTHAVLTNAVYFKASWDDEFPAHLTKAGPFWISASQSVDVPFMRGGAQRASASTVDADLVELPYSDGKMSMVIVVPKMKDGLAKIERELDALPTWLAALRSDGLVDLTMPRFSIAEPTQLADVLKQLGMKLPFTFPGADFSDIDGTQLLYISQVIHQATIDVNEQGTVATAATGLTMRAGGRPQQPTVVRADRPFLFLVRDRETNAILFFGRLVDPR